MTSALERLSAYRAPAWLRGGHAQTLWAAASPHWGRRPPPHWRRERWPTPDGDFVDVDWLADVPAQAPRLVLLHGLEGSSRSPYAWRLAWQARLRGWQLAVPHFRGCSGEPNRLPRAYHAGDVDEVAWLLSQLAPPVGVPLWAVGVSLGGNALLRWAAEAGAAARQVRALATVCAPLDLAACGAALAQGVGRWVYTPWFLRTMKRKAVQQAQRFPGAFDAAQAARARSLADFDDAFTAPLHGYQGVDDYWARASAGPHLGRVRLPALVLNPLDDPFVPAGSLPRTAAAPVQFCRPRHGGHVGFVGDAPWAALADWLVQPGHG